MHVWSICMYACVCVYSVHVCMYLMKIASARIARAELFNTHDAAIVGLIFDILKKKYNHRTPL